MEEKLTELGNGEEVQRSAHEVCRLLDRHDSSLLLIENFVTVTLRILAARLNWSGGLRIPDPCNFGIGTGRGKLNKYSSILGEFWLRL
jgi:hypothetical protein